MSDSSWPRGLRTRLSWPTLALGVAIVAGVWCAPWILIAVGTSVIFGWPLLLAYGVLALGAVWIARWSARRRPDTTLARVTDRLLDYVPLILALLSSGLVYWMWCQVAYSVRPGMGVRFMNEAMLIFAATGAGIVAGVPVIALRYRRHRSVTAAIFGCALLVAPFFVSGYLQDTVVREFELFVKP